MNKFTMILTAVVAGTLVSGQSPPTPPPPFAYPSAEKLRADGFEVQAVVTAFMGIGMVMKKGQLIYICELKPYTFNNTKEEFLKGEKCQRVL